jgi:hypothetical protein
MVERCCDHAARFGELLGAEPEVEVLTQATVRGVQEDGTCWLSGTQWQGRAAMRISVSNWQTSPEDVERSAAAILEAAAAVSGPLR